MLVSMAIGISFYAHRTNVKNFFLKNIYKNNLLEIIFKQLYTARILPMAVLRRFDNGEGKFYAENFR